MLSGKSSDYRWVCRKNWDDQGADPEGNLSPMIHHTLSKAMIHCDYCRAGPITDCADCVGPLEIRARR